MKALIFNSGLGSRLGELTRACPKGMVRLASGEAIFERQLRILHACGIREFVVTTGPFPATLMAAAAPFVEQGATFTFVPNPRYAETNYIYSMHLAAPYLKDGSTTLLLHGDLVFDQPYARLVIDAPAASLGSVNEQAPLPEKDFKARVQGGEVREVGVGIFDEDCVAFQSFYKLSPEAMRIWLERIALFVESGTTGVYAENAANEVFEQMHVEAFSYNGHCVEEVDTPDDLERVSALIETFDSGC